MLVCNTLIFGRLMSLKSKRILLIFSFALFLVLLAFAGYEEYTTDKKRLYESIDQKLKSAAFGTSMIIDQNFILKAIDSNVTKAEDLQNILKLNKFAKYIGVEYVYLMIEKNGEVIFVASNASDEEMASGQEIYNFDVYEDASAKLKLSFKNFITNYEEYSDKWGEFRSIFIPMKTKNGEVFVAAADIRIDIIEELLAHDKIYKGLKIGALLIFGFALFYWQLIQINKSLRQNNEKLNNQQNLLLAIFDNGETTLLKWKNDSKKTVEYASKSIQKLLGVSSEEFVAQHRSYYDFISKDDFDKIDQKNIEAIEKKSVSAKHNPYKIITTSNESKIVIDETFFAFDKNGQVEYCLSCIVDITSQVAKEKMMFEQSKLASMGEMIGNIAHHWRQPLSAISMIASAMELKKELEILDDEEFGKNLEDIISTTHYLSETINIFRDFIKDGREKSKINIKHCIENVAKLIDPMLKAEDIEFVITAKYDNLMIFANKNEIEHAILNILANSKDAIIKNNISAGKIDVLLDKNSKYVLIQIKDNGGGIGSEIIEKIFEPYTTTKHQDQGVGLGLYMSRQIICESLVGNLSAQNSDNGATISIEIPLADE